VENPPPEDLDMDIAMLREEIEKLVLLEEVAERRQQMIEEQLERAIDSGMSPETIRNELGLSKESIRKLLEQKTPELAERLGISEKTAENLSESAG
jgi:CRISPR/Cas system CSM-associated protein Csm2 small subunit